MEEVTKLLEQLAIQLGTTVEYLWIVLIKQAHVNAIVNLTFAGISGLIILIGLVLIPKISKLDSNSKYDMSDRNIAWIFYGFAMGISLIILGACSVAAITQLFNPEYWALQKILGKLQ